MSTPLTIRLQRLFSPDSLLTAAIFLVALALRAKNWSTTLGSHSYIQALAEQPANLYMWDRALTALAGSATVAILYLVGKGMFNGSRRVGIAAALMLLVSPLQGSAGFGDVAFSLAGLCVIWSSYGLSRTRPAGASRQIDSLLMKAIVAGLAVALATAISNNGLYLLIVPLTAGFMVRRYLPLPPGKAPRGRAAPIPR
ncbi:MAG: hypothetical protein M3014_03155, partial [Chloroflexota bacterium]|nr:hypothetical protein [Chloroflexota bacterium]